MLTLPKYSAGIGDRFGRQGVAQLQALQYMAAQGVTIAPVWNKSFREHVLAGTAPADVRAAAAAAVRTAQWRGSYFVDADHITLKTVEAFLEACDFFTIDVADWIGREPSATEADESAKRLAHLATEHEISGMDRPLRITAEQLRAILGNYLLAVREAGRIYRRIIAAKGEGKCIIEVSMDECATPQGPSEIWVILALLADEGVPAQTFAPKFSGRFNKGVDYSGDVEKFRREFRDDVAAIAAAARSFDLPPNLKISVHSGSDKYSLYGPMRETLRAMDAGLHLKTAGTTWLEELIGLAEAGGEGLAVARTICEKALTRIDELCQPYAAVIEIDRRRLPTPEEIRGWNGDALVRALRHDQRDRLFNPHFRQLLHVAYKVAAELGERFTRALEEHADVIGARVANNLKRHLEMLFKNSAAQAICS